jgi:hypothetical protein
MRLVNEADIPCDCLGGVGRGAGEAGMDASGSTRSRGLLGGCCSGSMGERPWEHCVAGLAGAPAPPGPRQGESRTSLRGRRHADEERHGVHAIAPHGGELVDRLAPEEERAERLREAKSFRR